MQLLERKKKNLYQAKSFFILRLESRSLHFRHCRGHQKQSCSQWGDMLLIWQYQCDLPISELFPSSEGPTYIYNYPLNRWQYTCHLSPKMSMRCSTWNSHDQCKSSEIYQSRSSKASGDKVTNQHKTTDDGEQKQFKEWVDEKQHNIQFSSTNLFNWDDFVKKWNPNIILT